MSTVDVIYIRNYPFNLQLAEFGLYHRHISGISHQTLTICLTVFMNKAVIMISCISSALTGNTYFVTRFTVLPLHTILKAIHSTKMILRHQQIKQVFYCHACIRLSGLKVYNFLSVSEIESVYDEPFIMLTSVRRDGQVILHPSSSWLCRLQVLKYILQIGLT